MNATYGLVEGARRGAKTLKIPRMRELKDPIELQSAATRRFLRLATDIIERCEQVSVETGCWLFFTAQHRSAKDPFLHYASRRIRNDAKKEVEGITNDFNSLFLNLIAARHQDSKEMHKKLLDAQAKEASTQKQLEEVRVGQEQAVAQAATARRELERRDAQMAATKAELEMYKLRLVAAGM
ncbi:hypothetical protein C8R44DRAFT_85706 [Mycena epipterygia]|nr:hypothetical protein C8R44DRAFT_85706 [Mycena epipterygia]